MKEDILRRLRSRLMTIADQLDEGGHSPVMEAALLASYNELGRFYEELELMENVTEE